MIGKLEVMLIAIKIFFYIILIYLSIFGFVCILNKIFDFVLQCKEKLQPKEDKIIWNNPIKKVEKVKNKVFNQSLGIWEIEDED